MGSMDASAIVIPALATAKTFALIHAKTLQKIVENMNLLQDLKVSIF